MRRLGSLSLALVLLLAVGCAARPGQESPGPPPRQQSTGAGAGGGARPPVALTVTNVATGLKVPWDVVFAPDGRAFVSEREGRVLELARDGSTKVVHQFNLGGSGEAGLLGLAVSPTFSHDGLLFAYYTTGNDNRVVRFRPGGAEQPILTGIPHAVFHDGGRIAFGPDGMLYVATGDATNRQSAQDLNSLSGKILRIQPDGKVPSDNPFRGSPVWSYGHRNVEGLAWDIGGRMFASEMGEDDNDEINLIRPGGNYGWPGVMGPGGSPPLIDPVFVRQPSEASWSGLLILTSSAIPQWEGDLLVAALRGQRLWRIRVTADGTVSESEALYSGQFGRLRAVVQAPDGSVWITTSNRDGRGTPKPGDDRIVRIGPPA